MTAELLRQRLGSHLKRLQQSAGLNQNELAKRLHVSQGTISKWQTGSLPVDGRQLRELLDALEADELDRRLCLALNEESQLPSQDYRVIERLGVDRKQRDLLRREESATELVAFELTVMPGLLQRSFYAKGLFERLLGSNNAEQIEAATEARVDRSRILFSSERTRFLFFIAETACRNLEPVAGDGRLQAQQLDYILRVGTLPRVSIRILPAAAAWPTSIANSFEMVDRRYVSAETVSQEVTATRADELQRYLDATRDLSSAALDPRRSAALVRDLVGELTA